MPYGLKVENSNGEVQIDSTYMNFCLSESGVASLPGAEAGSNYVDITFAQQVTDVPIVACRLIDSYALDFGHTGMSGSTYTVTRIGAEANCNAGIPYRVYRPGTQATPDGYGLTVYNDSGECVFSSWDNPMRIVGVYPVYLPVGGSIDIVNITVDDATNNYFFQTAKNIHFYWYDLGHDGLFVMNAVGSGLKRINSTTIQAIKYNAGGGIVPFEDDEQYNWQDNYYVIELAN